jgi:asparaginyl-tRNA synthetase
MKRVLLAAALRAEVPQSSLLVCGWVRTRRETKDLCFLELNDGSCLACLQCLIDKGTRAHAALGEAGTGAALRIEGPLLASPGKGQSVELHARHVHLFGAADPASFPLQKKRHSNEFLRGIAHLRPRTNKYGAVFRVRSEAAFAVHDYFRSRGFYHVHTPILTGSDCEGAGELFRVTTLPPGAGEAGTENDFFSRECRLTVSGQLEAEALALGLGRVYSFGPAFRAENSNTPRHAAEFWMIEPEEAFADIFDCMDLAEGLVRRVIEHALTHCGPELELFNRFVDTDLLARLRGMLAEPFARMPYGEAVEALRTAGERFEFPVLFGMDLQTEHERYLTEELHKKPVMVYDYPKDIKPFYMRLNDDGESVAAADLLAPRVGELAGGSQREERLELLEARIAETGQNPADYRWYLDLRRFGSVPHAGFGAGFERLLMLLTGIANIRDVIPFPRTPGNLEF